MPDVNATPISLKCKVCGGDIVNNYLAGSSVCAHCGNKWSISDLVPDYNKYSRIIAAITKANEIIESETKIASANEAKLQFKSAAMECTRINDAVTADLIKTCNDGIARADRYGAYIKGKTFYEKKSYQSAINELKKSQGYKNADEIIEMCRTEIQIQRKKQLPWTIIFSLILPTILCLALYEFAGLTLWLAIPIALACSAGLGYLLYRGGVWSVLIKIVSFLCAVPLILFAILRYGMKMESTPALIIAIGAPIAFFVVIAILTESKKK